GHGGIPVFRKAAVASGKEPDKPLVQDRATVEEIPGKDLERDPIDCDAAVEVEYRVRGILDRWEPTIPRLRAGGWARYVQAPFPPDVAEVRTHVRVPGILKH